MGEQLSRGFAKGQGSGVHRQLFEQRQPYLKVKTHLFLVSREKRIFLEISYLFFYTEMLYCMCASQTLQDEEVEEDSTTLRPKTTSETLVQKRRASEEQEEESTIRQPLCTPS